MGLPKYKLPEGTRFVESHRATCAGVKGEVHILWHLTPKGGVYEAVFACEIASQPCHIGAAFYHCPSKEKVQSLTKRDFVPYIERQKEIRSGWN